MRGLHLNAPLTVSLVALALAALVTLVQVPALAGALFLGAPGEDPTLDRMRRYVESAQRDLESYASRVNGRSFFFKPKPPPPTVTAAPPPARTSETIVALPPPTVPATYGGPNVVYVFGDTVCFADMMLRVGEERNGIKVLGSSPPWSVRLGWRGGEFEVDYFKRTSVGFEAETASGAAARGAVAPPLTGGGFVAEPRPGR